MSTISRRMGDYTHLRTVPAVLGIAFAVSSLYQFGGITEVHLEWLSYTLTTEHATIGSLVIFSVAFMSSDTKSFDAYEGWEKALIAMAPILIVGHQYTTYLGDLVANNSPVAGVLCFAATMVAWGVAVR